MMEAIRRNIPEEGNLQGGRIFLRNVSDISRLYSGIFQGTALLIMCSVGLRMVCELLKSSQGYIFYGFLSNP
jgi:hypothetical protein